MGILIEISNEEKLERAVKLKAKVININNRNLRRPIHRSKYYASFSYKNT